MSQKTLVLFEAALESLQDDIKLEVRAQGGARFVPCEHGLEQFTKRVRAFHGITDLLEPFRKKCYAEDHVSPMAEECCEERTIPHY